MTISTCPACSQGPKGIAGHSALVMSEHLKSQFRPVFVCATCGAHWQRSHEGSDEYAWQQVPVPTGDRMVGSPGTRK